MESENKEGAQLKDYSNRKRKKLYNKLREQMEFYFSDSNLAKDRFMYHCICQNSDGFVDLEVFKSFNKIKDLSTDLDFIADSLSRSNILEVNEDKSKVRRKTPFDFSKDFDACTVYVERLPSHVNLKEIKAIFENFGTVEYITIPRFKISQKTKGYAFVEFSSTESVDKACQFFLKDTNYEDNEHEDLMDEDEKQCSPQKKKRAFEADDSEGDKSFKRSKISPTKDASSNNQQNTSISEKNIGNEMKTCSFTPAENGHLLENSPKEGVSSKKKKKRKKVKEKESYDWSNLRVMSKFEWKNYRNKYLNVQRATTSYLKSIFLREPLNVELENKGQYPLNVKQELEEHNPLNFKQENIVKSEQFGAKELKFQPGVILKMKLTEPIQEPSDFKEHIKNVITVAYIDAPLGSEEVFIRCHTAEDANAVILKKSLNDVTLLEGFEEENYWKKIYSDREATFNSTKEFRRKKVTKDGQNREQKNKHMFFDE